MCSFHDDCMLEGCLITSEQTYNGFFHENQFHGKGVLMHADGSIFEGTFNKGGFNHGTLTTENWTYVGSFGPGNLRDGSGRLSSKNGDVYEGDFKDDMKHGIGVETRANGFVHHGNWENDLPHGHGTLRTEHVELTGYWKGGQTSDGPGWTIMYPKAGVIYEGEAKGGKPHGKGKLSIASGSSVLKYNGDFCLGLRHGEGVLTVQSHVIYEGAWIGDEPADKNHLAGNNQILSSQPKGDKTSRCEEPQDEPELESNHCKLSLKTSSDVSAKTIIYDNGDSFRGQVDEDLNRHGFGVYTVKATGKVYSGEWQCSKLQGMGTVTFPHIGATYNGVFVDGKMEGNGSMKFPDGSEYKGMFRSGMVHGCGKLRDRINRLIYNGQFLEGQKHGQGKETHPDGTLYEGEFAENTRHGQGKVYRLAQGPKKKRIPIYQGEFHRGVRNGKGERFDCTFPCRGSYFGEFKDGRQEGHGVFTTKAGLSYEGEWNNGAPLDGDWVITEPNGVMYYGSAVCSALADGLPVPEGFGSQKSKHGDFYTGSWVNGKRHGTGMCVFGTGEQWDGRWRNGVFVKFGRSSPYENSP